MLIEVIKFNNSAEKDKKRFKNLTIQEYLQKKNILIIISIIIFILWQQAFGHQKLMI